MWRAAPLWLLMLCGPAAAQAPIPGGCTEPAAQHQGQTGCWLTAEMRVEAPPAQLWWHIRTFRSVAQARAEAARHPDSMVTTSFDRVWLHVLGQRREEMAGEEVAVVGPLNVTRGKPLLVRFVESTFAAGMRTRVHEHPGPEASYVLSGVQCMESPTDRARVRAGESYVLQAGPHLQAAPLGRRSIAITLVEEGKPWMSLRPDWTPTSFCES
jgi:quercetin dioxygenase-like cupin family protein